MDFEDALIKGKLTLIDGKQYNTTGCGFLDKGLVEEGIIKEVGKGKGRDSIYSQEAQSICTNTCPYDRCVLELTKEYNTGKFKELEPPKETTLFLQCKCGASETLTMADGVLQRHWRWVQKGDKIEHMKVCGEVKIVEVR